MAGMKERILLAALDLFARDGYSAVSVSDIAGALGVTKGALYRHYRSKRDIFESILARMEARDAEQARQHSLPEEAYAEAEDAYAGASAADIIAFSGAMFRYWTEDGFASRFRKLLALERFRSPEMMGLYQQYLVSGPVGYLTDLFRGMGVSEPREAALRFYGPMFLLYSVYDGAEDGSAALYEMDRLLERARKDLRGGKGAK